MYIASKCVLAMALALLASSTSAHMIMVTPTPFNNETIDNSPLSSTGENFPCKTTGQPNFYNAAGIDNTIPIGATQTLSFRGSAVHGGGSCQLAVTKDLAPTASTSWQVILSIEGGCPAKTDSGPSTYTYSIPSAVSPGKYVFAWTWISKEAGQPEYYMNCAPITVTAAKKHKRAFHAPMSKRASLPNLFVANLASVNSCKTTPGTDPTFPDPGPTVQKPAGTRNYATVPGTDCFPKGGSSSGGSSSGGGSASATGNASSSPQSSITSASAPTSASSSTIATPLVSSSSLPAAVSLSSVLPSTSPSLGGSFGTANVSTSALPSAPTAQSSSAAASGSASAPAVLPTSSSAVGVAAPSGASPTGVSSASSPSASGSSGSSSSGSPSSSSAGLTGACTTEGMWNCIGGNSFQRCASGVWSPVTQMAGGTSCTAGQSESFAIGRRGLVRRGNLWRA